MGKPVEWNEILLDDTYFPILGPVRRSNFAVTPNPVLFGDTGKAGDGVAMTQLTQTDYLGGSGVHKGNVRTDTNRCWTSDLATYHHQAVHLPEQVSDLGVPSWAGATSDPRTVIGFNDALWVSFDDKIGTWAVVAGWAVAADHTCHGKVLRTLVYNNMLFVAELNTTAERRTAAGVWSDLGGGTPFFSDFAAWDNKLWGISPNASPILYMSLDNGATFTNMCSLPTDSQSLYTPIGHCRLAVYRDSTGQSALYVHADTGLYIYDSTFKRLLPTEITYSPVEINEDWLEQVQGPDGRLYVTNGKLGLVAVQTGNPMVLTAVGPDRDDGYPAAEDGAIVGLAADENFVYMLQHSTTNSKTILRGYRGGWHKFWSGTGKFFNSVTMNIARPITVASLSGGGAGSTKAVYFTGKNGNAPKVYQLRMPTGIYNPRFFAAVNGYQDGPLSLVTPWWPFESEVQQKIFGHIFVQARNHTATETTLIEYSTDLNESNWSAIVGAYGDANPITSDGLKEFFAGITGAGARWIRWRFTQNRDNTNAQLTPLMEFYTAEVMRVLGATYAYSVEVDLSRPHKDKTPEQLRAKIEALNDPQVKDVFYPFSWQDEFGGVRTHYGRISRESGQSRTGPRSRDGEGFELISIIVPYNRDVA